MPGNSLSSGVDQTLWFGVLAICAVTFVLAVWRKRRDGVVTAGELLREQRARLRDQREICKTTEDLLRRLDETILRGTAAAEAQAARLTRLIRDADERLDRLAPLLNTVDGLRERLSRAAQRSTAAGPAPQVKPGPFAAASSSAAPGAAAGASPSAIAPARRTADDAVPGRASAQSGLRKSTPSVNARLATHPRFAPVYDLADAGRTAAEIAAATELPLGEVELVLKLRSFA